MLTLFLYQILLLHIKMTLLQTCKYIKSQSRLTYLILLATYHITCDRVFAQNISLHCKQAIRNK